MKTIVALSTPPAKSGIAVVRMSGERALEIALQMTARGALTPNQMTFGTITAEGFCDKGYTVYFRSPHSFTGEDVVEFSLHGGVRIAEGVVARCIALGASPALPGEFTKRAYLNGKLDLSAAEGVMDMINAESASGVRAAYRNMEGELHKKIKHLQDGVMSLCIQAEAILDYPDEMADELAPDLTAKITALFKEATALKNSHVIGKMLSGGVNIVLTGEVNVGKSSLLNAFVGDDRAIVTDVAGTTRDTVTSSVEYRGVKLTFSDTAGLRQTDDEVEKLGVQRSKKAAMHSDVILHVVEECDGADKTIPLGMGARPEQYLFTLVNKCDLSLPSEARKAELTAQWTKCDRAKKVFFVSARQPDTLTAVLNEIVELVERGESSGAAVANERQYDCIRCAASELYSALNAAAFCIFDGAVSDLRRCLNNLGEITGEAVSEGVIDGIFSKFCVGK